MLRNVRRLLVVYVVLSLPMMAQTSYILTAPSSSAQSVADRNGLTIVKQIYSGANSVMLVTSASSDSKGVENEVESDLRVVGFEPDQNAALPEISQLTQGILAQSTTS